MCYTESQKLAPWLSLLRHNKLTRDLRCMGINPLYSSFRLVYAPGRKRNVLSLYFLMQLALRPVASHAVRSPLLRTAYGRRLWDLVCDGGRCGNAFIVVSRRCRMDTATQQKTGSECSLQAEFFISSSACTLVPKQTLHQSIPFSLHLHIFLVILHT